MAILAILKYGTCVLESASMHDIESAVGRIRDSEGCHPLPAFL